MRRRMEVPRTIFRAYDIRGIYGSELTLATAERVGATFAAYHASKGTSGRICIGRDARTSSPDLEAAVIAGLRSGGCDVESVGMIPIPVANWWTWRGEFAGGVYITASHNPAEYNGIRFRHPDGAGYTEGNIVIKRMFFEGPAEDHSETGKVNILSTKEALKNYTDFVKSKVGNLKGMRIAIDPGNGVGSLIIDEIFQKFGVETSCINNEPDGHFPNRPSEPAPKNLSELIGLAKNEKFDFSVAYDGDADRCVFIDDVGLPVTPEKIGIIVAKSLITPESNKVLAGVPCSMILEDEIPKIGGELIWIRVGDVFVCEELKKHNAALALEISAHFFAPGLTDFIFDDPIIFSLKLAEYLHKTGSNLSELSRDIPSYPYEEMKFTCPDALKFKVNEYLTDFFSSKGYKVETIDGVKIWLDGGWVLLRPSNTQPVMRMFVEAMDKPGLEKIKSEFKSYFDDAVRAIS